MSDMMKRIYILAALLILLPITAAALDTTPPNVHAGDDITVEATATLTPLSAITGLPTEISDFVDGAIPPDPIPAGTPPTFNDDSAGPFTVRTDAPAAGFPVGTTEVRITIVDPAGNVGFDVVTVIVTDTTPPTIGAVNNLTVEATGLTTFVALPIPDVVDLADPVPQLTNDVFTDFILGTTAVNYTATDNSGNTSTAGITVTLEDTTAPDVTAPEVVTIPSTGQLTPFAVSQPLVRDAVDDAPDVRAILNGGPPVGILPPIPNVPPTSLDLPIGENIILFEAEDNTGNIGRAIWRVTVVDTALSSESAVIADSSADTIVGARPVTQSDFYNQVDGGAVVDMAVAPDRKFVYGIRSDRTLIVHKITSNGSGAPVLTPEPGPSVSPIDLSADIPGPSSIAISADARWAYIAGSDSIVRVNLVQYVEETTPPIVHLPFQFREALELPDEAEGRRITKIRVHPDGDRLFFLIQGHDGRVSNGLADTDFGKLGAIDIAGHNNVVDTGADLYDPDYVAAPWVRDIALPAGSDARAFYGPKSFSISPDGNIALISASGGVRRRATAFGELPADDNNTGGLLVADLNTASFIQHIPSVVFGEDTSRIRNRIQVAGLRIEHPVAQAWRIQAGPDDVHRTVGLAQSLPAGGILLANNVIESLVLLQISQMMQQIYADFGFVQAYNQLYTTDMSEASDVAISPRGDNGLVTFKATNNYGLIKLGPSPSATGYRETEPTEFHIQAAVERTVNNLSVEITGDALTELYERRNPREIEYSGDGSTAFVGLGGGDTPRRFGLVDVINLQQQAAIRSAILPLAGLDRSTHFQLFGGNLAVPLSIPRQVSTFPLDDVDGDGVSNRVEAFNRFNVYRTIRFGNRDLMVGTSDLSIPAPGSAPLNKLYPFNYQDGGYFLPHSGVGYRYNYAKHERFSTNVGAAPAISTIEHLGRIWHDRHTNEDDGFKNHSHFVVTDMSHPGPGLIQDLSGALRHFNVRNGLQANIQYFHTDKSDRPFEFVLSNTPSQPINNTVQPSPVDFDWRATYELIRLALDHSEVEKVVIDPGVRDEIFSGTDADPNFPDPVDLNLEPKIEIHGQSAPHDGLDNDNDGTIDEPDEMGTNDTRRDMDGYMQFVFRKLDLAVENAVIIQTGVTGNSVFTTNLLSISEPGEVVPFKIDTSLTAEAEAPIFIDDGDENTPGHPGANLYRDEALTQPIASGDNVNLADLDGVLWLQVNDLDAPIQISALGRIWTGSVVALDVDVDSDNDNGTNPPDRSLIEDQLEETSAKSVAINNGDLDFDGILDFGDGFNADGKTAGDADSSNVSRAIPDDGNPLHANAITINNVTGNVATISVGFTINHAQASDIAVALTNPAGTTVQLFSALSAAGANFSNTVINDSAPTIIHDAAPPYTGTFASPGNVMQNFVGGPAAGPWTLTLFDLNTNSVTGQLTNWNLSIITDNATADARDDLPPPGLQFTPMVIELSGPVSPAAVLRFEYDPSPPHRVVHTRAGNVHLPSTGGSLRLWTKNGNQVRTLLDYIQGDRIVGTLPFVDDKLTLYIEAVRELERGTIKVSYDPDGHAGSSPFLLTDTVLVKTPQSVVIDIAVDSDNDGDIDSDDAPIEDIEKDISSPGRILVVNDQNADYIADAIPDFADFETLIASEQYAPVEVIVPTGLDLTRSRISLSYSDSPPSLVSFERGAYTPAPGHLRLWTTNGNQSRNPAAVAEGGDFVAPGVYTLSALGLLPGTNTLYMEAVNPSKDIADQRLVVRLDPDGSGTFTSEDAVRFTIHENSFQPRFAVDAVGRRLDVDGQLIAEPEPQASTHADNPDDGLYVDAWTLAPFYSVADINIPTIGPDLRLEFRRTTGITQYVQDPLALGARPMNPVSEDTVLGPGWRSSLGMRVHRYQDAYIVYDENGKPHRFNLNGLAQPRSVLECSTHRTNLTLIPDANDPNLIVSIEWGRQFWKTYKFDLYTPNQSDFGNRPLVGQYYRLVSISDRNSNAIICDYNADNDSYPASMHDSRQVTRRLQFSYLSIPDRGLRLHRVIDPVGNGYFFTRDSSGRLEKVIFPEVNVPAPSHAGIALPLIPSLVNQTVVEQYTYDAPTFVNEQGDEIVFVAIESITNPNNNVTRFDYDWLLQTAATRTRVVSQITTAQGSVAEGVANFTTTTLAGFTDTRAGHLTTATDSRGVVCEYEFHVTQIPGSLEVGTGLAINQFSLPAMDFFTRKVNPAGKAHLWRMDYHSNLFYNLVECEDLHNTIRRYSYGKTGGFDHSRYNRPLFRIIDPDGLNLTTRFAYDPATRKVGRIDKPNKFALNPDNDAFFATTFVYDDRRNVQSSTASFADENDNQVDKVRRFRHDTFGIIERSLDPDGRFLTRSRTVTGAGWTDTITNYREYANVANVDDIDPGAMTERLRRQRFYDLNGNLVQETVRYEDPDNPGSFITDVTDHAYDALNYRTQTQQPLVFDEDSGGNVRPTFLMSHDGIGNLLTQTDPRGTITTFSYDARERRTTTSTATGGGNVVSSVAYDAAGNVTKETDENGNEAINTYDELERLLKQERKNIHTDRNGNAVTGSSVTSLFEYGDNSGSDTFTSDSWNPTIVVDPREYPTQFTYDKAYRRITERNFNTLIANTIRPFTLPLVTQQDQFSQLEYDANSNLIKTTVQNPDGSGDQVTKTAYDEIDRPIRNAEVLDAETDLITHTRYDFTGNVVMTIDQEDNVVMTEYDAVGMVSKRLIKLSGNAGFATNGLNEFAINNALITDDDIVTTMGYDGRDNRIRETLRRTVSGALTDIHMEQRFDALNRVSRTIENSDLDAATDQADEAIVTYTYDLNSNIRTESVRREDYAGGFINIVTEHEYDELNRRTKTILPPEPDAENGGVVGSAEITFTYDDYGNQLSMTDARGMLSETFFDGLHRPISTVTISDGTPVDVATEIITETTYDPNDNVLTRAIRREVDPVVVAPGGLQFLTSTMVYDAFDRVTSRTDAETNVVLTEYDNVGNVIRITDPRGNTSENDYDPVNRLVETRAPPLSLFPPFVVDRSTNPPTYTQTSGAVPTTRRSYNARSLLTEVIDANGNSVRFEYDAARRRTRVTNAVGDFMTTEYDQADNVTRMVDYRGAETLYGYDKLNRRVTETDRATFTTNYAYDLTDNVRSVTDPKSNSSSFVFDTRGRPISALRRGNTTPITTTYNDNGSPIVVTDENGLTTTNTYDPLNRLITRTDHAGNSTTFTYDHASNQITVTDRETNATTNVYDRIGRLVEAREELGKVTKHQYDANSNRTLITDANGFFTVFEYDEINRLTRHQLPTAPTDDYIYRYDLTMNVVQKETPNNEVIEHTYDPLDREITRHVPTTGGPNFHYSYSFSYDPNSNRRNAVTKRMDGTTLLEQYSSVTTYDARDLVSGQTHAYPGLADKTYTCTYDENRVPDIKTTPAGRTIDFGTDEKDLFTSITGDQGGNSISASFAYDEATRLTTKAYGSNNTSRAYTYNNRNWLLEMANTHTGTSANVVTHQYDYNKVGFKNFEKEGYDTSSTAVEVADLYVYDELYRVTDAKYTVTAALTANVNDANPPTAPAYAAATADREQNLSLDLLHNRLTVTDDVTGTAETTTYNTAGADPLNRINDIQVGVAPADTLAYDNQGNMLDDGSTYTYEWDALNRLTTVRDRNTSAEVVRYVYDADNRRLAKFVTAGTETTFYIYKDWDVIEEYDDTDTLTAEYLPGRGMDEPLAAILGGQLVYFHQNSLGHVVALTDNTGAVIERYNYDAFGNVSVMNSDGVVTGGPETAVSPYLFTGRRYDPETGLFYFRNRYYSATFGRFVSTDPLNYVDGMNVYAYVGGNVTNMVDPMGTFAWAAAGRALAYLGAHAGVAYGQTKLEFALSSPEEQKRFNFGATLAKNMAVNMLTGGMGLTSRLAVEASADYALQTQFHGMSADEAATRAIQGALIGEAGGKVLGMAGRRLGEVKIEINGKTASEHLSRIGRGASKRAQMWKTSRYMRSQNGGNARLTTSRVTQGSKNTTARQGTRGLCFVAGTQVMTDNGSKAIEELEIGDLVWSKDDQTGEEGLKPVLQLFVTQPTELVHVVYREVDTDRVATAPAVTGDRRSGDDDVDEIIGTYVHPIWSVSRQAWTDMGKLAKGELLLLTSGKLAEVTHTWLEEAEDGKTFTTYNFEVADWHTYFVRGQHSLGEAVWVHNTGDGICDERIGKIAKDARKRGDDDAVRAYVQRLQRGSKLTDADANRILERAGVSVRGRSQAGYTRAYAEGYDRINWGRSEPESAPESRAGEILDMQEAITVHANRTGAAIERWLLSSNAAQHARYGRWARTYQAIMNNPNSSARAINFAKGIRGRFLDRRMNRWMQKTYGESHPGMLLDNEIPGWAGSGRPDVFFPDLGGQRVIFDFGGPSKMNDILKYQEMADQIIPVIPKSYF